MIIKSRQIGRGHPCFIIAEAGVNHNGDIVLAKKLVDAAKDARADAVKFQTFDPESLVSKHALKADYQKNGSRRNETQLNMLKALALDLKAHNKLAAYCRRKRIMFLSSPFDLKSVDMLSGLDLQIIKVPSGEITNIPYLRKVGALKKPIIVSTGMANMDEIRKALKILISLGSSKESILILHCVTEYPTPYAHVNLKAMLTIRDAFGIDVGFSDHTIGIEIPIAAVALGASVIEKHFTLDKNMVGPDHKASLEPSELKMMVNLIRNTEKALGDGEKEPGKGEMRNKKLVRKSIVAGVNIPKGVLIREDMLEIKRPGSGISSENLKDVKGKRAAKDIKEDDILRWGMLC